MTKKVSEAKALKVLKAVQKRFHDDDPIHGPQLVMDFDWFGYGERPAIIWEGGPYEWAVLFSLSLTEDSVKGVFLEPVTNWALGIYPDS